MMRSWVDVVAVLVVVVFAVSAMQQGFVVVTLGLLRWLAALGVALLVSGPLAEALVARTGWPMVWTRPGAFVGLWLLTELVLGLVTAGLVAGVGARVHWSPVNRLLAVLPGALQGLLAVAACLALVALLPGADAVRQEIERSQIGSRLARLTDGVAQPLAAVFAPALREAEGFITIQPPTAPTEAGGQRVDLPFRVEQAPALPAVEAEMLTLVNRERAAQGLGPLVMDASLQAVARAHAADMLRRGYFAHVSPEGATPFDRLRAAGIGFRQAGENLAFAPSVTVAHTGLMNSPGHRANILQPGFGRVGIGVLDAGPRGRVFVQLFRD